MGNFYTYLLSSLPALVFGMKPPLSFDALLGRCREFIPDPDVALVASLPYIAGASCTAAENATLKKWLSFDAMLRNELVKVRALSRKLDAVKYLRQDGCPESVHAAHIAVNAHRRPSPLEAEKMIDTERWNYLDELAAGHYFDLDALIVYAYKLMILHKWDGVDAADRPRLMEEALTAGIPQQEA